MVYNTQNYWVLGLFPSSIILENRKHYVSETGSVSVRRWRGEKTPTQGRFVSYAITMLCVYDPPLSTIEYLEESLWNLVCISWHLNLSERLTSQIPRISLCVCMCTPLSLLSNGTLQMLPRQQIRTPQQNYWTRRFLCGGPPGWGGLASETVKCGHESRGTRTWEWLRWRRPAAIINDRPIHLSRACYIRTITASVQLGGKKYWSWVSRVWRQDELIGGKPPVVK
jgi:hypothetical protein